ncbi:MAG: hypothetical protein AAGN15_11640 [Cyanobacteria bacterium J06581_3]
MNSLASLLLPAALGLIAGITHGVVSHTLDLPESLAEQVTSPLGADSTAGFSDF